jgi:hypothetical protein
VALTEEEQVYLGASLAERQRREAEERRAAVRLRRRAYYLAGALVLALIALAAAGTFARRAQANFVNAERVSLAAQAQNAVAEGTSGDVPALLALRSLQLGYSAQADAALLHGLVRGFPCKRIITNSAVEKVAFSPDGRYVLASNSDQPAKLWDAQTGKELRQFASHAPGSTVSRSRPMVTRSSQPATTTRRGSGTSTCERWCNSLVRN